MAEEDAPIETVTGPNMPADNPAPSEWYNEKAPTAEVVNASDEASRADLAAMVVDSIGMLHDKAAEITHYQGFIMPDRMVSHWQKVIKFGIRNLKMKDWGLIIALASLAVDYTIMLAGYAKFKQSSAAQAPAAAPSVPSGVTAPAPYSGGGT